MLSRKKISEKFVIVAFLVIFVLIFIIIKTVNYIQAEAGNVTADEAAEFLEEFGWKTGEFSQEEIVIPSEFTEVFIMYNTLQQKQGYDLSKYRSDTVTRYTFEILNYKDSDGIRIEPVEAHVLVYGGKIIGGDLCSTALDGFMTGFDGETS